jgi:archaetidylinositol phosphate synthase
VLNNLRNSLRPTLEKIGKGFASTGLSANFWTFVGLGFALVSAVVYGMGIEFGLIIGGVLLLVSGFFDMVDGQVARVTGKTSKKGEYLDSMFDKISEVAIFLGILVGGYAEPYLVLLAITLSLLVSYARAKSDIINIKLQGIGIGERAGNYWNDWFYGLCCDNRSDNSWNNINSKNGFHCKKYQRII